MAIVLVLLLSSSAYGWWLLNINTFQVGRPGNSSDFEHLDVLIVPEEATNVARDVGAYESLHVAYELSQKYPATKTVQEVAKRLKRLGWEPLDNDWLNPGIPSSHVDGWSDFADGTMTPRRRVHRWSGQWQDSSDNLVDYTFRYTYPLNGPPNLNSLWVNGSWYPSESVKLMQSTSQR